MRAFGSTGVGEGSGAGDGAGNRESAQGRRLQLHLLELPADLVGEVDQGLEIDLRIGRHRHVDRPLGMLLPERHPLDVADRRRIFLRRVEREMLDREDAAGLAHRALEGLQLPHRPGIVDDIGRRGDGDERRRRRGVLHQLGFEVDAGLEIAVAGEIDLEPVLFAHAKSLAQPLLQIAGERLHPRRPSADRLVVEMREADENVALEVWHIGHRMDAPSPLREKPANRYTPAGAIGERRSPNLTGILRAYSRFPDVAQHVGRHRPL